MASRAPRMADLDCQEKPGHWKRCAESMTFKNAHAPIMDTAIYLAVLTMSSALNGGDMPCMLYWEEGIKCVMRAGAGPGSGSCHAAERV